jgi:hypothetical protein
MNKTLAIFSLLTLFSLPTLAQDRTPVLEVGGGYQFRSFDQPFAARLNENGGFFTADFNINRWLGAATQLDATRIDQGVNGTWNDYGFMFGPQIYPVGHHRLTPFVHVLFGASHVHFSAPASGGNPPIAERDTAFSFEGGAGMDWYFARHVGIRLAEFDYERQYFFGGGGTGNPVQNNFKFSAGVVLRIGER